MSEQISQKPAQVSSLNSRLRSWHERLQSALSLKLVTPSDIGLAALSPLKSSKRATTRLQNSEADFCWHLLLNLLMWRGCELSLNPIVSRTLVEIQSFADLQSLWCEIATLPFAAMLNLETIAACHEGIFIEIVREIGKISVQDLTAEFLANLPPQFSSHSGRNLRKRTGAFYTPTELAVAIVAETLSTLDLEQVRVLDPACGGGIFLLSALDFIAVATKQPARKVLPQLYGLDLNPVARDLCLVSLLRKCSQSAESLLAVNTFRELARHIQVGNALIGNCRTAFPDVPLAAIDAELLQNEALAALPIFNAPGDGLELQKLSPFHWQTRFPEVLQDGGFDAVIGNPPYVGFNDYSGLEKAYFAHAYPEIYNLKADLLYYFIYRGTELLKAGGKLGFIVSRFWREATFAARLRQWLSSAVLLEMLCDLKEDNLFDDVTIDTCLLFLRKRPPLPDYKFQFYGSFQEFQNRSSATILPQRDLGKAPWTWLQRPLPFVDLLQKIEAQSMRLGQVASCRTGVQTGYDRAFFVNTADRAAQQIEPEILRPALKNSDIFFQNNAAQAGFNWASQLQLLYPPNNLTTEQCQAIYPGFFAYLQQFQNQLEKRQRYDKAFDFWQLQWPREPELFVTKPKLITPYKAPRNTFAVDNLGFFFSTDIISIIFTAKSPLAAELEICAANILCSRLSTFQFRSYCKQMSGGQYDYYANPVKQLLLPASVFAANPPSILTALASPQLSAAERDELVFQIYDLSGPEIDLVIGAV